MSGWCPLCDEPRPAYGECNRNDPKCPNMPWYREDGSDMRFAAADARGEPVVNVSAKLALAGYLDASAENWREAMKSRIEEQRQRERDGEPFELRAIVDISALEGAALLAETLAAWYRGEVSAENAAQSERKPAGGENGG